MKKYFIGFIFGLIIAGTISVSAYTLLAKDVSYTPSWTKENGESITNVKDAMDGSWGTQHLYYYAIK